MKRGWTGRGPWVIAATSADADWRVALTGLAAAAGVPVAVVVLGTTVTGDDPVRAHAAGLLEGADRVSLERARDLVGAMTRAYELVLVAAPAGLLVPVAEDGWTLVDLAVAAGAPAVVVTGPGEDAANHTTLTLDALTGRGIAGTVVTIGEVDLPVPVAGRIPAGTIDDFTGAADWFDAPPGPTAGAGAASSSPSPERAGASGAPTVNGKRFVLGLLGVFLVMVMTACGLGWCSSNYSDYESHTDYTVEITAVPFEPVPRLSAYVSRPASRQLPAAPRPSSTTACPENAGQVGRAGPDAATTARVNRAWQRIEKWLDSRAPVSARALRPPADPKKLEELQRRMSVAFPPDLVVSLRRHDGLHGGRQFSLPPFHMPLTLGQIYVDWQANCQVLADDIAGLTDEWWHPSFVPFAADGSGGNLLADQRSGGHGRVGEFFPEDGTDFDGWPASVAELLELTGDSLETGRPFAGHYRPVVTAERTLDWELI